MKQNQDGGESESWVFSCFRKQPGHPTKSHWKAELMSNSQAAIFFSQRSAAYV